MILKLFCSSCRIIKRVFVPTLNTIPQIYKNESSQSHVSNKVQTDKSYNITRITRIIGISSIVMLFFLLKLIAKKLKLLCVMRMRALLVL